MSIFLNVNSFLFSPTCPRLKTVDRYNVSRGQWELACALPMLASGVVGIVIQNKLFCALWEKDTAENTDRDFLEYNTLQERWISVASSLTNQVLDAIFDCITHLGSITYCETNRRLYLITMNSATCIQVEFDEGDCYFQDIYDFLPIERFVEFEHKGHCGVMSGGRLYVLGGEDTESLSEVFPTASVYMYCTSYKRWQRCASMIEPRSRFSAVELGR